MRAMHFWKLKMPATTEATLRPTRAAGTLWPARQAMP